MKHKPFKMPAMLAAMALLSVTACSPALVSEGVSDPEEAANRNVHRLNLAIDQGFLSPVSQEYGKTVPGPVRERLQDFSANTSLPSIVVNNLLQGEIEDAAHNAVRFLFNSTLGLAGLFDIATDIGLEERSTDFGETLHVWGVPEGNYVVMPFFGPSTERDAVGTVVDMFSNPLSYVVPTPHKYFITAGTALGYVDDRYTFGPTVDSILYESEDGYAAARLLYLDNRRFNLSDGKSDDALYDIYEEAYD